MRPQRVGLNVPVVLGGISGSLCVAAPGIPETFGQGSGIGGKPVRIVKKIRPEKSPEVYIWCGWA
ncbi:hypothetical protein GCM10012285_07320 [Streptomyces kronopolitis]|uniref:Secreted protein n=1 Tax=Streptomyces kronopolitis TaxID=1612435 RepID=A0ABQ2J2D2_9ACTN|nr:hypothetical protein GCM10012285_07320 [Streptomyces kronopolitis]